MRTTPKRKHTSSGRMLAAVLLALVMGLTLCGCVSAVSLTEEEEEDIAIYAANVISKFNSTQGKGIVAVSADDLKEEEPETEETEEPEEASPSEEEPVPADTENAAAPAASGAESAGLSDIVGISGLQFSYEGASTAQDYGTDAYFVVSPGNGNSFLVLTFSAKNVSDGDIEANLAAQHLQFAATLGEITATAESTMLINDLTTYDGTIAAGETQELVVLFQFPSEDVSDLSGLSATVRKDGTKYQLVL